jgi:hypothetical protein
MFRYLLSLFFVFLIGIAQADCDAPALRLPHQTGLLERVIRNPPDAATQQSDLEGYSFTIEFSGFQYEVGSRKRLDRPYLVDFDFDRIKQILTTAMVSSEHYYGPRPQDFNLADIECYDLNGDSKCDLVFFTVSTGANAYPGVIGFTGDMWVSLVEPNCY